MIATKYISAVLTEGKRFLKILCYGKDDIRTTQECMPFGIDSSPVENMSAIYASTDNVAQDVIIGYINKNQLAATGEFRFYSTNSNGDIQASGWFHADGKIVYAGTSIELLGNANHAAQYEGLQAAFNQLKADFNNAVTIFNAHIHADPQGGSVVATLTPFTTSAADITAAKLTNIKTQ